MNKPLAERIRPKLLKDYLSQQHLVGKNGALKCHIISGVVPSLILWGPPGTGKTTLANVIANETKRPFYKLSAINSGVKDIRNIIDKAKKSEGLFTAKNPILFIDEIHRFSKSQQDSLLEAIEKGWVTLIAATTENPSFEVISALLSRCQVYNLHSFSREELKHLLERAITVDEKLKTLNIHLKETEALLKLSGGDARKILNILELVVTSLNTKNIEITNVVVANLLQENTIKYDKTGDMHYDIISAFIKSVRGSDPNAAVYYLARMLEAGEDVKFIARRLLILASEDVGNANPTALVLANSTFNAVSVIGMPEARIILSQCAIYLACSPKSNAAYMAVNKAQSLVKDTGNLTVPLAIRNATTNLMKDLGYGKDYRYAHEYKQHFVVQEFLPEAISNTKLYEPGCNSRENLHREHLKALWKEKYGY